MYLVDIVVFSVFFEFDDCQKSGQCCCCW